MIESDARNRRNLALGELLRGCPRAFGMVVVLALSVDVGEGRAQEPLVEVEVHPTEVEWLNFPPYCRARYSITLYAAGTAYQGRVPGSEIESWRQRMGDAWTGLHHYCYGLVQMSRAPLISDAQRRAYVYGRAVDEFAFAYNNTPHTHPFAAQMAVQLAMAHKAIKQPDQALRYVEEAARIDPALDTAYSAKAILQREQRKLSEAVQTLLTGLEATNQESAELNYFLGLTYLDLGQHDLARQYADKAYALGYPLPGLRNRLARLGQTPR